MLEKIVKWLIFSVLIALVPLIASWLFSKFANAPRTLEEILSDGELFLVTAGLCAAGIGELVGSTDNRIVHRYVSGGLTTALLLLSALLFAMISNSNLIPSSANSVIIFKTSLWVYVTAIISSAGCAILSEK